MNVDNADNLDIIMPMYNLTEYTNNYWDTMYNLNEYSNNYWDTSGSLWQFKRDEESINNGVPVNVNTTNSTSFKYKSSLTGESTAVDNNMSIWKRKNSRSTKLFEQFLEIIRNAID